MSEIEYAILKDGEIVNVCTTARNMTAEEITRGMTGGPYIVQPLDSLPLAVKRRYRYWEERP